MEEIGTSEEASTPRRIRINRPIYSKKRFEDEFGINNQQTTTKKTLCNRANDFARLINPIRLLNLFTIIDLFATYKVKLYLLSDIISGVTVGIVNVPAALAYGALTSLNPVHGLYTAFFCGLVYILFGTSKHLSVGTFAVTSLMVYSTIARVEMEYRKDHPFQSHQNISTLDKESFDNDAYRLKLGISTCLAFWCGIFQVIFSCLRCGIIYKYLPRPLLRSFTTAAGFHVFSSQVKHVFGIYIKDEQPKNIFNLFYVYLTIVRNIELINWAAVLMSVISITALILFKNQIIKHFKGPMRNFPIELFVIFLSLLICSLAKLDKKYDLQIVGHIPKGFPSPLLPDFSLFVYVAQDALVISIVAFATSLSVSDLYARKHRYKINSNKEFFALGMANIVGAFFKCVVSCASLARTAVVESSGGKTQLVTVISSGILLTVMLWLSSFLEGLPKACLASIIIAAILNILKQVRDVKHYWKVDKLDCLIWVLTFLSSVILDIDYGLGIGIITVLFLNTYRSQNLELKVVGRVKDYELYSCIKQYYADENDRVKVVRPTHSLFYLNSDFFRDELNAICPLKDLPKSKKVKFYERCCKTNRVVSSNEEMATDNEDNQNILEQGRSKQVTFIILDCTNIQYIDEAGFNSLKSSIKEYEAIGVGIFLTNCHEKMLLFFARMNFDYSHIYMTIQDAIETIKNDTENT